MPAVPLAVLGSGACLAQACVRARASVLLPPSAPRRPSGVARPGTTGSEAEAVAARVRGHRSVPADVDGVPSAYGTPAQPGSNESSSESMQARTTTAAGRPCSSPSLLPWAPRRRGVSSSPSPGPGVGLPNPAVETEDAGGRRRCSERYPPPPPPGRASPYLPCRSVSAAAAGSKNWLVCDDQGGAAAPDLPSHGR
jgi:hypothetical protein